MIILGDYYKDETILRAIIEDHSYNTTAYEKVGKFMLVITTSDGAKINYYIGKNATKGIEIVNQIQEPTK